MRIIDKPWGKEELLEHNDRYMFKRLTMHKGCRCSLQKHELKWETIYVLSGSLTIFMGSDAERLEAKVYGQGQNVTIEPGIIHRMAATEEDCVYLEASTPELEDVIRISDDYHRA